MVIQKGSQVHYWPTVRSPSPLNTKLGTSLPAIITKVASTGAGNAFAAVRGATLNISVTSTKSNLQSVPLVIGVPSPAQLISGFCSIRPYVPPPLPLTFDQAVAKVKLGNSVYRTGVRLTPADVEAADWSVG